MNDVLDARRCELEFWEGRFANGQRPPADLAALTDLKPWCKPVAALPKEIPQGEPPRPGEVLLTGVRGGQGVLMHTAALKDGGSAITSASLQAAWQKTERLALGGLDWLLHVEPPGRPLAVKPLMQDGGLGELTGSSYMLAFALSHASVSLGLAVPAQFAALAALDNDGKLISVRGLEEKVSAILKEALAVDTLLVAPEDEDQVNARVQGVKPRVDVKACKHLAEAYAVVWSQRDLAAHAEERLGDFARSTQLIEEFYEQSLEGSDRYLRWKAVADTIQKIEEKRFPDASREWKLRKKFAQSVAKRHDGDNSDAERVLSRAEDLLALEKRPAYKLRLEASLIQAAMDGGRALPDRLQEHVGELEQRLTTNEILRRGELKVLGAWSRMLIRDGELHRAAKVAEKLVEQWSHYRQRDGAEISHPLSVLYHGAGLLDDADLFTKAEEIRAHNAAYLNPRYHWTSFARMRALALLGRAEEAAEEKARAEAFGAPKWMAHSLARWEVRLGLRSSSEALHALNSDTDLLERDKDIFSALIALDQAVAAHDEDAAIDAMKPLEKANQDFVERLKMAASKAGRGADALDVVSWVADVYPD